MRQVQEFIARWLVLEEQIRELRIEQKDLAEAMKAHGVPTRTATMALKQLRQRRTLDSTVTVFDACCELLRPLVGEA